MSDSIATLTEEQFAERFPLRTNHINPASGWYRGNSDGCLFAPFGPEFAYIQRLNSHMIWTVLDGYDGELYIVSGLHQSNPLGYLVSDVPIQDGSHYRVHIPMNSKAAEFLSAGGRF